MSFVYYGCRLSSSSLPPLSFPPSLPPLSFPPSLPSFSPPSSLSTRFFPPSHTSFLLPSPLPLTLPTFFLLPTLSPSHPLPLPLPLLFFTIPSRVPPPPFPITDRTKSVERCRIPWSLIDRPVRMTLTPCVRIYLLSCMPLLF